MFVLKSKYDAVTEALILLNNKYDRLVIEWNNLIDQINEKGGKQFLSGESTQFSKEDIQNLIKLCHPDKHSNNSLSNDMTKKLLRLKNG